MKHLSLTMALLLMTVVLMFTLASGEMAEYMSSNSMTGERRRWKSEESTVDLKREKRAVSEDKAGLTTAEITQIMDVHNSKRMAVIPNASNMRRMEWNDELAKFAQDYACKCDFRHTSSADRAEMSFGSAGENLFVKTGNWNDETTAAGGVTSWFNEATHYTFNTRTCASGQICGHYTQGAWADTYAVGCGRASCDSTIDAFNSRSVILVCNYGPAGNYQGAAPYQFGTPCMACPAGYGQCADNLCGRDTNCNGMTCDNGGTLSTDGNCVCTCPDGFYGGYCASSSNPAGHCSSRGSDTKRVNWTTTAAISLMTSVLLKYTI